MKQKKEIVPRTRNYATVVYPESAPADWFSILESQMIPAFVSPLHDKDVNPGGEPKKAHYHVMIMFDSVKTRDQAREIFEKIGGVGCEVVNSIRGMARYLCHADNPEKAKYFMNDVRALCGADYINACSLVTDKYVAIDEILAFCESNRILSYRELITYCRINRSDWFRVLCDNGTYVVKEYLKSWQWEIDRNYSES